MTPVIEPQISAAPSVLSISDTKPSIRPVDIDEYNRMIDVGAFGERKCELIDGEIIDMAAIGAAHVCGLEDLRELLGPIFPRPAWFIKTQATQRSGQFYAPDPDITILTKRPVSRARLDEVPTLVVEVSDSTLHRDLTVKRLHYARSGVREYWVINLHRQIVHVFREPNVNATHHAEAYASERQVGIDGIVAPLVDETKTIRVADFMPTAGAEPDETA